MEREGGRQELGWCLPLELPNTCRRCDAQAHREDGYCDGHGREDGRNQGLVLALVSVDRQYVILVLLPE